MPLNEHEWLARSGRGTPVGFSAILASTTGVTDAAIEIAASTAGSYTVVDSVYISCDDIPTDADFTLDFVGLKTFALEYDELGADGIAPIWGFMDYLDPNPAANTAAFWLNKSLGSFIMAPTGDSISIDGRNAAAGDNYVGTNAVALTITVNARLIDDSAFW